MVDQVIAPRSEPPSGATLAVRDVFRIYREADIETVALRGIDLVVSRGEYIAVMGRSGSGKSTLLNLLGLADHPSAGSIEIDGSDLAQAAESARAARRGRVIGRVLQSGNLVEFLDLVENIELATALAGRPVSAESANAALDRVGLALVARRRPGQLSGGEQQRAALASALATRPRLLLVDEPTGELDSVSATSVLDALDDLRAETGMTVVVATHDASVAARADRVAEIQDGVIVAGRDDAR